MLDSEVRIIRLEEALADTRRLAQAALEMASRALQNQFGGGTGFGGSVGSFIWGRAVASISARSGTTLGTGSAHISSAPDGVLTEGTKTVAVLNGLPKVIADDAWIGLLPDDTNQLIVIYAADPCADLSDPA